MKRRELFSRTVGAKMEQAAVRLDWDDARYFLALSRHRSLRGAARSLSVSASTMARRIEALEERLTATLFDRIAGEFVLNASGDRFLETAEKVESLFFELGRDIVGSDARLEGHIKLALPADLGGDLLMPAIKAFSDNHPATTIEFASSYAFADLSRREADIAVRAQTCEVPPQSISLGAKSASFTTPPTERWTCRGQRPPPYRGSVGRTKARRQNGFATLNFRTGRRGISSLIVLRKWRRRAPGSA